MTIDLYYMPLSAPCRSIMMAAKLLGVELNLKFTDLMAGEHMKPEYIEMNFQHTIPTLNDNGFVLTESRAILAYLASQYGKDSTLYPQEPKGRALVDSRMYFDMGVLYQRYADYTYPALFMGQQPDPEKKKKLDEALGFLEHFLTKTKYAAADHLTLADLTLLASISTIEATYPGLLASYPKIEDWLARCKTEIPDYEETNQKGADAIGEMAKNTLHKQA